jgi:polyisoprenoid-binding protein YceI
MTTRIGSILPLRAGSYTVDREHSGVYFRVRRVGLTHLRGQFTRFDASLLVGESLHDVAVRATIDLASLTTQHHDRDAFLHTTQWFDADTHPAMTFNSTSIHRIGPVRYMMDGLVTMVGVTKPVRLQVGFHGIGVHSADDRVSVEFTAIGQIRRSDYGVELDAPLGASALVLGDAVRVAIDARFLSPSPTGWGRERKR